MLQAAGAAGQLVPAQLAQVVEQPISSPASVCWHFIMQPDAPWHVFWQVVNSAWWPAAQDIAVFVQPERSGQPASPLLEAPVVVLAPPAA
jgi:hypothetical protein